MSYSLIEDIYDYEYDKYLDNLQNIVEDSAYYYSYVCSCCNKECNPIVIDDSFGYDYGSIIATHKQYTIVSDCCEAEVITPQNKGDIIKCRSYLLII